MPFLKSLAEDAGPPAVFEKYPELYGPWAEMSEMLMNGASPIDRAERELLLAFAAGVAGCRFVYVAHSEVAYERGIREGLLDELLVSIDDSEIRPELKPVLRYVKKLVESPAGMVQSDADAVLAAGWDERALHDVIAITARACFMQRLVEGHGFVPMTREVARERARRRVERGYVNLYPGLAKAEGR